MTRPKSHKVALTKARRQETWQQLTAEQQAVLIQHIRYRQTSLMMDRQLFGRDGQWLFKAYHFNDAYDTPTEKQLYCACGRRLKHQYVLENGEGTEIRLGITHFADHLGIPETVMRQLQTQIHHINFGLDEILQRIRRHAGLNPTMQQWFITHHHNYPDLPPDALDFVRVGLPLEKPVQADIFRYYKQATYQPKPRRPKPAKLSQKAWAALFQDI
ncbi:hypothetical protein [Leuconostoc lactis]|uniref:hypothetical protein n=1 Tax=Leuconostoc lactis TaxID=1246 RepID=UPI0028D33C0F|nr:hypothetical protein [Leuconostoc lactis]